MSLKEALFLGWVFGVVTYTISRGLHWYESLDKERLVTYTYLQPGPHPPLDPYSKAALRTMTMDELVNLSGKVCEIAGEKVETVNKKMENDEIAELERLYNTNKENPWI